MSFGVVNEKRIGKWYFGGIAASGAACITHPLDLLKVHLQTQDSGKIGLISQTAKIIRREGILGIYNGLSASILRQMTYSMTRFAVYEVGKQRIVKQDGQMSFFKSIVLAGGAGAMGGFVGTPGDMINVRMQNDMKIPKDQRRNYKHALDGVVRVWREEGPKRLFNGATTATTRAVVMTIGQIAFYEQVKAQLLKTKYFKDNMITHFLSSLIAGTIATGMTQPLDVLKTRAMNAKPGEFSSFFHLVRSTAKLGPMAFFKGFVPAFVRLGPHTVLLFVFLEQIRIRFGTLPPENQNQNQSK